MPREVELLKYERRKTNILYFVYDWGKYTCQKVDIFYFICARIYIQTFIILIELTSLLYSVIGKDDNLRIVVISYSYVIVDSDWKE